MYSGDEFYSDEITSPIERTIPMTTNTIDPRTHLQALAIQQATESFTDDYVRSTPIETRAEEGLGIALAHWAQWDGLALLRVFYAALEDANFHTEAGQVQEMIDRLED